jgi:hypothetical protein
MASATLEVGDPESPGAGLRLSVSQVTKFTTCENRWLLSRTLPKDQQRFIRSDALILGTLMHSLLAAWRSGRRWQDAWIAAVIEEVGDADVGYKVVKGKIVEKPGWDAPKVFLRAIPIMEAWVRVHGPNPAKDPVNEAVALDGTAVNLAGAVMTGVEVPFEFEIPGVKDAVIRGFIDALISVPAADGIRVHDTNLVVEDKTMGKWGRENQVPFDLQLNVYLKAARQMFKVEGAVFEAVSTYAYKPEEGKGPESVDGKRFKRLYLPYDQRLVDRTMDDVAKVARRMRSLLKNPGLAIRNVGDACTYCDFRKTCLTPWED